MPGGLTRVAPDDDTPLISNQLGAMAKDTWVLASEPQRQSEFWLTAGPVVTAADPFAGLSQRAAENLFWVGRYAERAESVARLLRAVHDRRNTLTVDDAEGQQAVDALLRALSVVTYSGRSDRSVDVDADAELFALACDVDRPGSLAFAVSRLLASTEAVRDQLSVDTWLVTGTLERQLATLSAASNDRHDVVQETLGAVLRSVLALHGLAGESMVRDAGWHFLEAGRRIERFQHLALLLRATLGQEQSPATESLVFESVLMASESIITYRRRYRSHAQLETLLDLLVGDPGNPRSLRFQADRLEAALAGLPGRETGLALSVVERDLLTLSTALRVADSASLVRRDADGGRAELSAFLDDMVARITTLAVDVAERSFAHILRQQSLSDATTVVSS